MSIRTTRRAEWRRENLMRLVYAVRPLFTKGRGVEKVRNKQCSTPCGQCGMGGYCIPAMVVVGPHVGALPIREPTRR